MHLFLSISIILSLCLSVSLCLSLYSLSPLSLCVSLSLSPLTFFNPLIKNRIFESKSKARFTLAKNKQFWLQFFAKLCRKFFQEKFFYVEFSHKSSFLSPSMICISVSVSQYCKDTEPLYHAFLFNPFFIQISFFSAWKRRSISPLLLMDFENNREPK